MKVGRDYGTVQMEFVQKVTPEMMVRAAWTVLCNSRDVEEARWFIEALGLPREIVAQARGVV